MQFYQPPFQTTGFPSYDQPCQPCGFNPPIPPIPNQINVYPDIIGEGNVASIITPEGRTQLIFFPTLQWPPQWRTFLQNSYLGNFNNPYINNLGAWFVRNIFNPIQPTVFPQPRPEFYSVQYPRAYTSEFCLNLSSPPLPGLPIKFHNDICTSTTDIQYFIPKQFNWFRRPTECASVQVASPLATTGTACDYELLETCSCTPAQPCNCPDKTKTNQNIKCMCRKQSNTSQMSIDSTKSKRGNYQNTRKTGKTKRSINSTHIKNSEPSTSKKIMKKSNSNMSIDSTNSFCSRCIEQSRKTKRLKTKKSHVTCECKPQDKSVITYAEQGIGCAPDKGRETQTSCCNSIPVIQVSKSSCNSMRRKAETWQPKYCTCDSNSSRSCSSETEIE